MEYGTNDLDTLIGTIPPNYKNTNAYKYWEEMATACFEKGIRHSTQFFSKPSINKEMAIRHIKCILNTHFLTKKQKIENLTYILSLWFYSIKFNH
jgi:hypothetical protein